MVRRGGQTTPGSSAWCVWETNLDYSVTDPTFTAAAGTEQRIFHIDADGNYYLFHTTAYTSDSSARASGRSTSKAATVQQKAITGSIK
jgi:hypothetical protein